MDSSGGTINVLDGYSPAKMFELRLAEVSTDRALSPEQAQVVFEVFDQVLPQLGIFKNVLEMVRNKIVDAVYSHQYTSSKESHSTFRDATNVVSDRRTEEQIFIKRIPYFSLVQNVRSERNEEIATLCKDVQLLENHLSDETRQREEALVLVAERTATLAELKEQIADSAMTIEERDAKITELTQSVEDLTDDLERERDNFDFQKRKLQERLAFLEKETEFLGQYKNSYDTLRAAFDAKIEDDKYTTRKARRSVFANKTNHQLANLESAKKLERQLLEVQNQTIEEFESFLESHKAQLQRKVYRDTALEDGGLEVGEFDEEEMELERLDGELSTAQDLFQQTITALNVELQLIRQHRDSIEQQQQLKLTAKQTPAAGQASQGTKVTPSRTRSVNFKEGEGLPTEGQHPSATEKDGNIQSSTEKDSNTGSVSDSFDRSDLLSSGMDPFIPQEAVLSKYSVMIYTSTNHKKTWHELKDAKYCASCGEKTVLCPHKVNSEKLINLPVNCTHIKLSRPRLRIANVPDKSSLKPHPPSTTGVLPSSDGAAKRIRSRYSVLDLDKEKTAFHGDSVTPGITDGGNPMANEKPAGEARTGQDEHTRSFMHLWDDYKARTTVTRMVPKPMNIKRTLSIIGQFYSQMLWKDENAEEEPAVGVLTALYQFLLDRFMLKDIMYLCAHDFITAVVEFAVVSKAIQIFCHILVSNLDAAVLRYLLVVGDLIDRVDWQHVDDFKTFVTAVYPFLNEDEVDQLHLGYTSFSENKISKALVCEYVMYIILKFREPRFQDIESKLLQHPCKELGLMTQREFCGAVDALSPLDDEKCCRRLFDEAQAHRSQGGKVAVTRLSHIASYLLLRQAAPHLRQKIAEGVEDGRIRTGSTQTQSTDKADGTDRRPEMTDDIMTAAKLRNLANNVARRAQNRTMRRLEGSRLFDSSVGRSDTETGMETQPLSSLAGSF